MVTKPLYSPRQVALSGFLSGPWIAIYFIKSNFRALGDPVAENKALLVGTIIFIAIFSISPFFPEYIPSYLIGLLTLITSRMIVEKYQLTKQGIEESDIYCFQSNWRVFWLSLLSIVLFLSTFMAWYMSLRYFGA